MWTRARMLLLVVLISAPFGAAEAQEGLNALGAVGGARAFSGHDIEVGENRFALRGVTCPPPDTDKGRRAKALANTFLRMTGTMVCKSEGGVGDCTHRSSSGIRDLSRVMLKTGLCWTEDA